MTQIDEFEDETPPGLQEAIDETSKKIRAAFDKVRPAPKTPIDELVKRAAAYLAGGGMWNPELAEHDAVRNLIRDCRDALEAQAARVKELEGQTFLDNEIERMQRYGKETIAGLMARVSIAEAHISALEAQLEAFREAATPFADIVEHDIHVDEADQDIFRPMTSGHNLVPLLRVGDMRKLRAALMSALKTETDGDD